MNVLIVNCFNNQHKGIISFSSTQILLRKLFQDQKLLIDNHCQFYIRSFQDLSDFIYESNSNHQQKDSLKNFNSIDMIFVFGQQNMTPWQKEAKQLLILLRMCLQKEKICFVSQFGMLCLLYIANLNFDQDVNIINGNGQGSPLSEIFTDDNVKHRKINDDANNYFLDNLTGDLYKFRFENQEWQYKGNLGMYSRVSAGKFHQIGNLTYKVPVSTNLQIKESERINQKLQIDVNKPDHWALQIIPSRFRAKICLNWELSTGHIVSREKQYIVLAKVDKNPAIISFNDCSLGILFEINSVQEEGVQILNNFIKSQIPNLIQSRQISKSFSNEEQNIFVKSNKVKISVESKIQQTFPQINTLYKTQPLAQTFRDSNLKKNKKNPSQENQIEKPIEDKVLKKQDIRLFLHPGISLDNQLQKQFWVPGMMSGDKPKQIREHTQKFQKYF